MVFTDRLNQQRYLVKRVTDKPKQYADSKSSQYYVLGDNQQHSFDSRHFGLIKREQVQGKALWILMNQKSENRVLKTIDNQVAINYF